MSKLAWVKSHWLPIAGVAVAFVAYRSLSSKISSASAAQDGTANAQAPALTQSPIFVPNAGGYDSVSGITSGLSTGTDTSTSQTMLDLLGRIDASQKANDALAITGANASAVQSVALNSSVSNTVAKGFTDALSSFLSSPNSNVQALNINADPTSNGGINLTAKKDINLAANLTLAQAANYAPDSNVVTFSKVPPSVTLNEQNFDSATYMAQHPALQQILSSGMYNGRKTKPGAEGQEWLASSNPAWAYFQEYGLKQGDAAPIKKTA